MLETNALRDRLLTLAAHAGEALAAIEAVANGETPHSPNRQEADAPAPLPTGGVNRRCQCALKLLQHRLRLPGLTGLSQRSDG